MGHTTKMVPDPKAILEVWLPFKKLVGVTSVHSKKDYERARKMVDMLLDKIGENENHSLAEFLDYLAEQVKAYEDRHIKIPAAKPHEVLQFLMDQHELKQSDLEDCAPQGRISDILKGKRGISKEIAKRLAKRFHLPVEAFL